MTYEPPVTDYDYIVENCTCAFCGCNCDDLDYLVKDGHVVAVRHACRLGASKIMEDMDQRLLVPMIRDENGELIYDSIAGPSIQMDNLSDGNYTFLIPPAENMHIDIHIETDNGVIQSQISSHNFQSGRHYICQMKSASESIGIYTAEDFIAFTHLINGEAYENRTLDEFGSVINGKMTYRLQQDIRFTEEECARLLPIGLYLKNSEKGFDDIFDGQGHTLSNLTIHTYYNALCSGLFGYITTNGTVKNLTVADSRFATDGYSSKYIALFIGKNDGLIDRCRVMNSTIEFTKAEYAGGLVAVNTGTVRNSSVTNVSIIAKELWAGALIPVNYGNIKNCYAAECNLKETAESGGLCHTFDQKGSIENCYVYSIVNGKSSGELIFNGVSGTIRNCYYDKKRAAINSKGNLVTGNLLHYNPDSWELNNGNLLLDILNEWVETKNLTAIPNDTYAKWSDKNAPPLTHVLQE